MLGVGAKTDVERRAMWQASNIHRRSRAQYRRYRGQSKAIQRILWKKERQGTVQLYRRCRLRIKRSIRPPCPCHNGTIPQPASEKRKKLFYIKSWPSNTMQHNKAQVTFKTLCLTKSRFGQISFVWFQKARICDESMWSRQNLIHNKKSCLSNWCMDTI